MERLPCTHSGTYADDCICERVRQHKCYIVATCDRDLRRRLRKACAPCPGRVSGVFALAALSRGGVVIVQPSVM